MDKFVLIDGNSLLNRAFYAISPFTARDGQPTNGIFGFVKLLFKILEDESPKYLAAAFDLRAPTFRHKLYDAYKGTRKGMPEELAVQVPVLKDLLRAMNVCIVEKEGYEADDLIGTLSRKFDGVETVIFTGDRDSFQLVKENVSVCFTKRGVSMTDRLTAENFYEKTGLKPFQIIEEKALMGDPSDNIPGVRGIGPKLALDLLRDFGTAEKVFENLEKLSPALRKKLEGQEEISRLSHTLATIDTAVPLDLTLSDCALSLPFPQTARDKFLSLEFRSLLGSPFLAFEEASPETPAAKVEVLSSFSEALEALERSDRFAFCFEEDGAHLCVGTTEYLFPSKQDLLGPGFFPEDLKPLLTILFSGKKRALVSDLKALSHRLRELGIAISCPVEDVPLFCYLADSNRRAASPKDLAQDFALPETNCAYALERAFDEVRKRTEGGAEETLYRDLELPLEKVLLDMEETGVRVDEKRFPEFSEKYNAELKELSGRIYALSGEAEFNLNSPSRLSEVLFVKMGLPHGGAKKNARGDYPTGAEVLEKLAEEHEIARLILRYREIKKLQSTYIDGIRPLVKDGFVHTTYNQTMTATGRLSSANPNLQNIPVRTDEGKELRKLFIAREGNVLIDADYSQIELRLLAHFSGCKSLQRAYLEGRDIHAATAAKVFGVPPEEVTPLLRRRAKAVGFGIIYGISAFGLSKDIGCTTREAQETIDGYFAAYPEVKEYMEENVRRAKADGYVTTILGRKRYIPELKSSNFNLRSFGERAAMNMPLQGSSADIIKLAMLAVHERLRREGFAAKLVLQVHDELVLDAPLAEKDGAAALLKEEMERAVSLSVPLTADVSCGESWYDAK